MVCRILPDAKVPERTKELDERLLASPALALDRCRQVLDFMAATAVTVLKDSLENVIHYKEERTENIRRAEDEIDHLEDVIGTYLLKLTSRHLNEEESARVAEYMKLIGDYERIADHAVNILESSEEMKSNNVTFSENATYEYSVICEAVTEILDLSYQAFLTYNSKNSPILFRWWDELPPSGIEKNKVFDGERLFDSSGRGIIISTAVTIQSK